MPTYSFINNETGETWDEFFSSYTAKDQYLAENPNIKQQLSIPKIVSHVGVVKTPDSWKEHLRNVKKSSGRNNTIKT